MSDDMRSMIRTYAALRDVAFPDSEYFFPLDSGPYTAKWMQGKFKRFFARANQDISRDQVGATPLGHWLQTLQRPQRTGDSESRKQTGFNPLHLEMQQEKSWPCLWWLTGKLTSSNTWTPMQGDTDNGSIIQTQHYQSDLWKPSYTPPISLPQLSIQTRASFIVFLKNPLKLLSKVIDAS